VPETALATVLFAAVSAGTPTLRRKEPLYGLKNKDENIAKPISELALIKNQILVNYLKRYLPF
jgi:hypothetical protein